ncbi:MAG: Uma2 family endonuclease [Deltaproteobacteria bacterium]|nr:Uma2 family endonuclease [Deltaproteobacteria bacterium]
MALPLRRSLMTAEELFELPGDDYKYELVEGELIRMAPTGGEHGVLTVRLGRLLDEYVEAHDLGIVCGAETGFVLRRTPDTVRAPDAAFIAKDRIPASGVPKTYWPFPPDVAVEVVSPSDRFDDVQTKVAEYLTAGTRLVWVVNPTTRTIFVYHSARDVQALGEEDELNGEEIIPGFRCSVRRVFT